MNYGEIGYTIGREISHAFDSEGIFYSFSGSLVSDIFVKQLMDDYNITFFDNLACFTKHYSDYYIPQVIKKICILKINKLKRSL